MKRTHGVWPSRSAVANIKPLRGPFHSWAIANRVREIAKSQVSSPSAGISAEREGKVGRRASRCRKYQALTQAFPPVGFRGARRDQPVASIKPLRRPFHPAYLLPVPAAYRRIENW